MGDEAMIDDPEAKQPEDWDMRKKIDDPSATKPDNWDDDEDGEGEPPKIDNPDEKFVENVYSYDDIGSVGFELWTVNSGSIFDNIYVTDSLDKAWEHADAHWAKISEGEKDAQDAYDLDDEDGTDDEDL